MTVSSVGLVLGGGGITGAAFHFGTLLALRMATGWDPNEHHHLGFSYIMRDREFGKQSFAIGDEFPVASDPTLWGSLELIPDG